MSQALFILVLLGREPSTETVRDTLTKFVQINLPDSHQKQALLSNEFNSYTV